jgi:hypothetical protein
MNMYEAYLAGTAGILARVESAMKTGKSVPVWREQLAVARVRRLLPTWPVGQVGPGANPGEVLIAECLAAVAGELASDTGLGWVATAIKADLTALVAHAAWATEMARMDAEFAALMASMEVSE